MDFIFLNAGMHFIFFKNQIADILTKPFPTTKFFSLQDNLNVCELHLGLRTILSLTLHLTTQELNLNSRPS